MRSPWSTCVGDDERARAFIDGSLVLDQETMQKLEAMPKDSTIAFHLPPWQRQPGRGGILPQAGLYSDRQRVGRHPRLVDGNRQLGPDLLRPRLHKYTSCPGLWSRVFPHGAFLSCVIILCGLIVPAVLAAAPPNVILIVTDDQGWGDFGFNGNPVLQTPHLDALAEEGVLFERFYVSPVCSPTRASLLTGRHFLRTGVWSVTRGGEKIRSTEITLGDVFRDAGYRTGYFGKWHNGSQYPYTPTARGFDEFLGFTDGHLTRYFDARLLNGSEPVLTSGFVADVLTRATAEFATAQSATTSTNQPFFAVLAYNTPHSPFELPAEDFEHFRARGQSDLDAAVYGLVRNIDRNLGFLLSQLEQNGLRENTLVAFLSDNGPAFPGGNRRYNGSLRGSKGHVTEGGIRVPLILSWPRGLAGQRRIDTPSQHIDLLPTLAELAGIELPPLAQPDGASLAPLLTGTTGSAEDRNLAERLLFTAHFRNTQRPEEQAIRAWPAAVHQGRWSAVRENESTWRLYDLDADPGQRRDIAGQFPGRIQSLARAHQQWYSEVISEGFLSLPAEAGHSVAPLVTLPAHEGIIKGKAFDYAHDYGWAHDWVESTGDEAGQVQWPLKVVAPGSFRLRLEYACADTQSGCEVMVGLAGQERKLILDAAKAPLYEGRRVFETGEAPDRNWALSSELLFDLEPVETWLNIRTGKATPPRSLQIKSVLLEFGDGRRVVRRTFLPAGFDVDVTGGTALPH